MKRLLLLLLFLPAFQSIGQVSVEVVPADTLACYHDSIVLEAVVTGADVVLYKWLKNGVEVPFQEDSLLIFPGVTRNDTAFYQCVVTYGTETDTSNLAHLQVYDEIVFDTLYRNNELGCPWNCKGIFTTLVSGGLPPYTYKWGPLFQKAQAFGLCPGLDTLKVTDMRGCREDTVYLVDVLKLPKVEFEVLPNDTVYLTNPIITMEFPDTARPYMRGWEWKINKGTTVIDSVTEINPAGYTFDSTGTFQVYLYFTDQNGCKDTIIHDVVVKTAELKIPGIFTPNGDNVNDKFEIRVKGESETFDYRIVYMGTELLVWDRWGKKVYSQKDYESGKWDGGNLPDGVYFYVLNCKGKWEDENFRGTVTILGRSK